MDNVETYIAKFSPIPASVELAIVSLIFIVHSRRPPDKKPLLLTYNASKIVNIGLS